MSKILYVEACIIMVLAIFGPPTIGVVFFAQEYRKRRIRQRGQTL
jgi:hypothetical protein